MSSGSLGWRVTTVLMEFLSISTEVAGDLELDNFPTSAWFDQA